MDQIQIIFEFPTPHGTYRDALWLPVDHGLSDAQLDALKQERLDNWLSIITAPPPEEPLQDG
jgi:hypothetical protein